jgi:twitching motility protein PilT
MTSLLLPILPSDNATAFGECNDTDFAYEIEGVARFRANYFRDRKGMGAVFRQIPYEIIPPEKLGIPAKVMDLCWRSKGLVLVTGPTGSGKSTTLAALVDFINEHRNEHIITIEDPIEFVHTNKNCLVNQREIGVHTNSFKTALRAALREDPDIVLVGEMRDLETIAIAIETAETGHLVFGTLHTNTAVSTVDRIIDQFPPTQQEQIRVMLAESLAGVVAQVLCKKKKGGRVAAYEVLMMTPAASNLIREGKTYQLVSVMQTGKRYGMQTMNEHLLYLVVNGHISPEEAYIKSTDSAEMKKAYEAAGIEFRLVESIRPAGEG